MLGEVQSPLAVEPPAASAEFSGLEELGRPCLAGFHVPFLLGQPQRRKGKTDCLAPGEGKSPQANKESCSQVCAMLDPITHVTPDFGSEFYSWNLPRLCHRSCDRSQGPLDFFGLHW